jgi:DNA (cytosine-5)-methyltransferase 1
VKNKSIRPPIVRLYGDESILDGFAGGGGASTGIEMAMGRAPDVAINHDATALAMHRSNHPETRHICSNIRLVNFARALKNRPCAFAWFSPDCTYFSKARGKKPHRDRDRARRIRGLAWEAVRCVVELKKATGKAPRAIFIENVEEFQHWCPLGKNGLPDEKKRGQTFRRWVSRMRNLGGNIQWRELRACDFGAPTTRKRLFIIIRFDGQPIIWPTPSHGPTRKIPWRTAAECIDWSLPVPSIFMDQDEAKEWGKDNNIPAPRRPLAAATLRRIARGIMRYVVDSPSPFIIHVAHGEKTGSRNSRSAHSLHEPLPTQTGSRDFAIVYPFLTEHANASAQRNFSASEPLRTICAGVKGGHFALVAPTLIQTGYGERQGQKPRILDIKRPIGTIVGSSVKHSLVAAFLAKHNGGHEATGQKVDRPMDTVVTHDQKALVVSHLMNMYGNSLVGSPLDAPVPTITSHARKIAEVRAFLVKFYGSKRDGRPVNEPLDTITTKERFGLVTVTIAGEEYVLVDIGMRMLTPRELFVAQGFPKDYCIDEVESESGEMISLSKKAQTRLVGNSVSPHVAQAIIQANICGQAGIAEEQSLFPGQLF